MHPCEELQWLQQNNTFGIVPLDMTSIDFKTIDSWIAKAQDRYRPPFSHELIAGGRSNLTFEMKDSNGEHFILRHPPLSHVLPTAHDMTREYKIISALEGSVIPVPKSIALCTDPQVSVRPFYLMEFVEGRILRRDDDARDLAPGDLSTVSESVISTLVRLHLLDVDSIGLADLGKKEGYLQRQLKRWSQQFERSVSEVGLSYPVVVEAHSKLSENVPLERYVGLVHGDYRLDNTVIGEDFAVAAVLDWEICTLGDTLADLGLLMVYWTQAKDKTSALSSVTEADGFYTREQLTARYAQLSSRDISDLPYYIAFSYWKLACILAGVYSRYVQGAHAGDPSDVSIYKDQIEWLGEQSRIYIKNL